MRSGGRAEGIVGALLSNLSRRLCSAGALACAGLLSSDCYQANMIQSFRHWGQYQVNVGAHHRYPTQTRSACLVLQTMVKDEPLRLVTVAGLLCETRMKYKQPSLLGGGNSRRVSRDRRGACPTHIQHATRELGPGKSRLAIAWPSRLPA